METTETLPTIEIFSDIHCPWGYLATFRLRQLQQEWQGHLRLAWRCLPLEVVNSRGTPKRIVDQELPYLLQVEPDIPARPWRRAEWEYPVTLLPAFEALKCAEAQGDQAATACAVVHVLIVGRAAPDDVSAHASAFGNGLTRRCKMAIQHGAIVIRIDGDDVPLLRTDDQGALASGQRLQNR